MLDDAGYIKRFDSQDALRVAAEQPAQLEYQPVINLPKIKRIDHVVLNGMGGSALAGDLCRSWWQDQLKLPFEIARGYDLPAYVSENTLVICSSYSGNTEEDLSCFEQALERGAAIVAMASGGQLQQLSEKAGVPFIQIPDGYQPRMAVWFDVRALSLIFDALSLTKGADQQLYQAITLLHEAAKKWGGEVPTANNPAKQLAEELMGKAVWVYGGPCLAAAAYKWKINFSENAKNVAAWNELPEFNHNEYIGWTGKPVEKPFGVVELQSSLDSPRINKRFELTNRLLSGMMPAPQIVPAQGKTHIEQLLWSCLFGDFVTIYLGILNGVNPTRVEAIEKFKHELSAPTG